MTENQISANLRFIEMINSLRAFVIWQGYHQKIGFASKLLRVSDLIGQLLIITWEQGAYGVQIAIITRKNWLQFSTLNVWKHYNHLK